jgi:hypothetical protein
MNGAVAIVAFALLIIFCLGVAIGFVTVVAISASEPPRWVSVCLVGLAALLAGSRGEALRGEWRAHLAGESGHDPVTWQKVKEALGFVSSAIQYRLADVADAAWTPIDTILRSRKLSNLVVFGPTALAAQFILRHLGTVGFLTSAESIAALGGALYALIRTGRWWRGVKMPEPKARRAKSDGGNE